MRRGLLRAEKKSAVKRKVRRAREPVDRSLDVLAWIADHPSDLLVVRQIARDIGTSPSTVHRLFQTFEQHRLIGRADGEYVIGVELYRISTIIADQLSPARIAHRHLALLTKECGETTMFGIYDPVGHRMMFVDKVDAPHPLRYVVELHRWLPIHAGATGLAILAFLPPEERARVYADGLKAITPNTIVTPTDLEAELERIRKRGYAHSIGQRTQGAVGFAAPVFDSNGSVCGDVCLTGPEHRFSGGELTETIATRLKAASSRVTEDLRAVGYRVPNYVGPPRPAVDEQHPTDYGRDAAAKRRAGSRSRA
jgi:DNA-binding IclR family transcriptional regulator